MIKFLEESVQYLKLLRIGYSCYCAKLARGVKGKKFFVLLREILRGRKDSSTLRLISSLYLVVK